MFERLFNCDALEVGTRSAEERAARSSQNKALDALFSGASLKGLEYCGVLAVHRENGDSFLLGARGNKLAAGYKRLFVGESYVVTRFDCGKSRLEARYADDAVEYLIGVELRRGAYALFAAEHPCGGIGNFCSELRRPALIGNGRYFGLELPYLLFEQVDIRI